MPNSDEPLSESSQSSGDDAPQDAPRPASWMRPYDTDLPSSPSIDENAEQSAEGDRTEPEESPYALQNPPEKWKHAGPDWHRVEKIHPAPAPAAAPVRRNASFGFLVRCNLLVFLSSVCVMVLELTASRLIAKHVGSSLYTWTSVIGVVLAGITVGNFVGGWLAERFREGRVLGWLFFLASVSCLSVLWLDRVVAMKPRPEDTGWPTWVFAIVAQMFFLPALALGTISPVVASLAIRRSRRMGLTVGNVYAWGALGSILGTFLTGFWLIDQFGTRMIIGGTAGVLAMLGILVTAGHLIFRTALAVGWLQFLLITTAAAAATSDSVGQFAEHTARLFAKRDSALQELAAWYRDSTQQQLGAETRDALKTRQDLKSLAGVETDAVDEFRRWCRSGNRQHMSDGVRLTLEALIAASHADEESVRNWRSRGQNIGLTLNELGLLLFLRSDLPGEYHDESNYSYINVSANYDDDFGAPVRQLRLDKLVHSYFDPENPTELYYEYEQIYAEVTDRIMRDRGHFIETTVKPFAGRETVTAALPDWASFDSGTNTLTLAGNLTAERRRELLALAPPGDYWLAIEQLAALTQDEAWGGFSSVKLDALPDGAAEDAFVSDRLTFESTFKTLNVFRVLDAEDVDKLCSAGSASDFSSWRNAVNSLSNEAQPIDTFFIGGGGFIFPRWIEHFYSSESRIVVAELDPAVKLAVQREMGLPPDDQTRIRTLIGDARNTVDDLLRTNQQLVADGQSAELYDFVYGDAFNDFSVPWHLTTREFAEKVHSLLKPETGAYLINVIDFWPRTVWPETADGQYRAGLADGFPAALKVDFDEAISRSGATYWDTVPRNLAGFEASVQADGTQHFAVRGVMPDRLLDRLKQLATEDGSPEFLAVLDDLSRRSRERRGGRFLASCTVTLADVFPHIYVFSTSLGASSDERDTFVLVASLQQLKLNDLEHRNTHWSTPPFATLETRPDGELRMNGQMESLLATSRGLILTDDYAPVDNLLRPVFEQQDN